MAAKPDKAVPAANGRIQRGDAHDWGFEMKRVGLLGVAVAAMGMAVLPSAQAAQTHVITGSQPHRTGSGVTFVGFGVTCDPAKLAQVNGIDGWVVPVTWPAGTVVTVTYSGVLGPQAQIYPNFLRGNCGSLDSLGTEGGANGAALRTTVPPDARWMAIMAVQTANISITVSP